MPEQVIHDICLVQAQDFEASGGGVPDLILWSVEKEEVKFVEVKSTNDRLSETQKVWSILGLTAMGTVNLLQFHL
jgi:fanconi-associated nuclease 1